MAQTPPRVAASSACRTGRRCNPGSPVKVAGRPHAGGHEMEGDRLRLRLRRPRAHDRDVGEPQPVHRRRQRPETHLVLSNRPPPEPGRLDGTRSALPSSVVHPPAGGRGTASFLRNQRDDSGRLAAHASETASHLAHGLYDDCDR